ncbi:MAG: glycosyltransferase family 4 protein [Deltaproteobacteria bacterium]|nr:glycosyltransferase family 4 protein [Deltaproteobacteria bacterium]
MKRRIIHLIDNGRMGGREKQLYLVVRWQSGKPWNEVSVLFQRPYGEAFEWIRGLPGVKVWELPKEGDLSPASMWTCLGLVRGSDLVFLHSPRAVFMVPLLLVRKPLAYRLSGMQIGPPSFFRFLQKHRSGKRKGRRTGPLPHSTGRPRIRPGGLWSRRIGRVVRWLLFLWVVRRRADLVLVNSLFLKDLATREYGVPDCRMRLVRGFIDPAFEKKRMDSARPYRKVDRPFTVSFVGRLDPRKRIDRLIDALPPLFQQGLCLRVLVAGDGDAGLKEDLVRRTRILGLDGLVEFLGAVENPYTVLKVTDLFVLPSDNEAFSNAVLEAMFADVPVVLFRNGCGNAEVLRHGKDAFFVSTVEELSALIGRLAGERDTCLKVGRGGRRALYRQRLTPDSQMEQLERVVEELA